MNKIQTTEVWNRCKGESKSFRHELILIHPRVSLERYGFRLYRISAQFYLYFNQCAKSLVVFDINEQDQKLFWLIKVEN